MNDSPIVHIMPSTSQMILCADDCHTSNLSNTSWKLFWLSVYHRNISTVFVTGTSCRSPLCSFFMPFSSNFIRRYSNGGLVTLRWHSKVQWSMFSMTSQSVPVFRMIRCGDRSRGFILSERQNAKNNNVEIIQHYVITQFIHRLLIHYSCSSGQTKFAGDKWWFHHHIILKTYPNKPKYYELCWSR